MTRSLLRTLLSATVAMLVATTTMAQDVLKPSVDVTLRSDGANADKSYPTYPALELYTQRTDGEIVKDFVGLMSFDLPQKEGLAVKKATLRLVTERAKGSINIYALDAQVSDADTYNSQKDNVAAARAASPIATLRLAGTNGKAVTDGGASSVLADWENEIDITAYAREVGQGRMAIMLANAAESTTNAVKVYSSDAQDVTNTKVDPNFTFAAADLWPTLTVEYEEVTGQETQAVEAEADVTLRSDGANADKSFPSYNALELYTQRTDGEIVKDFVGLMMFELPEKDGKILQSATLRLVTERAKGSINIYALDAQVSDADTYNSQKDNIVAARAVSPIANLRLAGTNGKAVTDGGASSVLADWVNEIDITAYAREVGKGRISFLLENAAESTTTSVKVYTSDVQDVTNTKVDPNFTFAAADLKPVINLVYIDGVADAIEAVEVAAPAPDTRIFTISGQRVDSMSRPGIYIVGGKKIIRK